MFGVTVRDAWKRFGTDMLEHNRSVLGLRIQHPKWNPDRIAKAMNAIGWCGFSEWSADDARNALRVAIEDLASLAAYHDERKRSIQWELDNEEKVREREQRKAAGPLLRAVLSARDLPAGRSGMSRAERLEFVLSERRGGRTIADIARALGLSRERARQILYMAERDETKRIEKAKREAEIEMERAARREAMRRLRFHREAYFPALRKTRCKVKTYAAEVPSTSVYVEQMRAEFHTA